MVLILYIHEYFLLFLKFYYYSFALIKDFILLIKSSVKIKFKTTKFVFNFFISFVYFVKYSSIITIFIKSTWIISSLSKIS